MEFKCNQTLQNHNINNHTSDRTHPISSKRGKSPTIAVKFQSLQLQTQLNRKINSPTKQLNKISER